MVALKECCCGCTLRTGTLILLWSNLIGGVFMFLKFLSTYKSILTTPSSYSYVVYVYIVAMGTGIFGIYGIHENKPEYLNGIFYFYIYVVTMGSIYTISAIFVPSVDIHDKIIIVLFPNVSDELIFTGIFVIALFIYFAWVVKSCRDVMMKNGQNNDRKTLDLPIAAKDHLYA